MSILKLKKKVLQSDFIINALNEIKKGTKDCLFYNLNKSVKAFLLTVIAEQLKKKIVFITSDNLVAEEYCDDLEVLLKNNKYGFFPDFETIPYEDRSPHFTVRSQRIELLDVVKKCNYGVFPVSVYSLYRRMINPKMFYDNTINIKKGEEIDLIKITKKLINNGYELVSQITKIGEIAKRGGILDVFSPHYQTPVRIDFWGDKVESIKGFNLITQRSDNEDMDFIDILPFREFSLDQIKTKNFLKDKVESKGFYEGIETDVSLLIRETASFLDFFNINNTIVVWDEPQENLNKIINFQTEVKRLWKKAEKKNKRGELVKPEQLYYQFDEMREKIKKYQTVFLSTGYQEISEIDKKIEAPFFSQTILHGQISMLEEILNKRIEENYEIFILSDNKSQSKRIKELLKNIDFKINFSIGVLQKGFYVSDAGIAVFTDHEIFARYKRKQQRSKFSQSQAVIDYEALKPGDYIVHIDYGIGVYLGMDRLNLGGNEVDCLKIEYDNNDKVYVPTYQMRLVSKFVSEEGFQPQIHRLGSKRWIQQKSKIRKQIELVAEDLVKVLAERRIRKGIKHLPDSTWQREMENSFLYDETPDQARSIEEIKNDMEAEYPMERLLCGDVGFGKTEVAIRVAFKAVISGFQVAILVPTTILCEQHYFVIKERLAEYPVKISMLSRFRTKTQIKNSVQQISNGDIDIVVGTHRLLSKDVEFKKLGLLIIDEEHRFGVRHKNKLRELKSNVDTLYMSATPIPRTMSMALSKMKEISLIQTAPIARLPVRTVVTVYDEELIKEAVNREVDRGGQVFFVHNRVETIESVHQNLKKIMPNIRFRVAHGQMNEKILENVLLDFTNHKCDVLVATTIIENGLDIPNANTMFVDRADMFGLAQLYQIRGRVGRSNRRAYAYFIIPQNLSEIAKKRLETLTEYNTLGAGYQIAMRDLELRGAGTLLGTKQSGAINAVGFNFYNKTLEQAIRNIEEKTPDKKWEDDAPIIKRMHVESDFYISSNYINQEKIRLDIYRRMLKFEKREQFKELAEELKDRFGTIPKHTYKVIQFYTMKMIAEQIGLFSFKQKESKLILEFGSDYTPTKEEIGKIINNFDFHVSFGLVGNLKIIFTIYKNNNYDIIELNNRIIDILDFILKIKRKEK